MFTIMTVLFAIKAEENKRFGDLSTLVFFAMIFDMLVLFGTIMTVLILFSDQMM